MGRVGAFNWIDKQGDFWLYGGYSAYSKLKFASVLSDLWKYTVSTRTWTLISGNYTLTPGSWEGATVHPGGRRDGTAWVGPNGNLWLLGGFSLTGVLSNMWEYSIPSNRWSLMYGNNTIAVDPVYTKDTNNPAHPGARYGASSWSDNEGHFWLFGGSSHVAGGRDGRDYLRSELWRFNILTEEWTLLWGPINHEGWQSFVSRGKNVKCLLE